MRPTRASVLIALALAVGLIAWAFTSRGYESLPTLAAYTPASVFVLALAEGYWARVIHARVHDRDPRRRPLHTITVARAAALAKASSLVGAVLFGVYAGFLGYVAGDTSVSARSHDTAVSAAGVACSFALALAALSLERACRVPPRDDDNDGAAESGRDGGWS